MLSYSRSGFTLLESHPNLFACEWACALRVFQLEQRVVVALIVVGSSSANYYYDSYVVTTSQSRHPSTPTWHLHWYQQRWSRYHRTSSILPIVSIVACSIKLLCFPATISGTSSSSTPTSSSAHCLSLPTLFEALHRIEVINYHLFVRCSCPNYRQLWFFPSQPEQNSHQSRTIYWHGGMYVCVCVCEPTTTVNDRTQLQPRQFGLNLRVWFGRRGIVLY